MKKLFLIGAFVCLAVVGQAQTLKQSTASTVNVKLTKISDGTDHTGLTVTGITLKIIKHSDTLSSTVTSATCAASGSSNDCVEVAVGVYNVELSASNTDTLGRIVVCASASGDYTDCVERDVVAAVSYASGIGGDIAVAPDNFSDLDITGNGEVNIGQILGTTIPTPATAGILDINVKNVDNDAASAAATVTFPATIASTTNITAGTITTATNVTTVNGLAANTITATAIAADAIGASEIAADAIGASEVAASAITSSEAPNLDVAVSTRGTNAVERNSGFQWGIQMVTSGGIPVTTGTVACTRSIDGAAFAATTNSPGALNSDGFTELVVSAADMNGTDYVVLKCTVTSARNYYTIFKLQAP